MIESGSQSFLGGRLDVSGSRSDVSPDCVAVTDVSETGYTRSADGTNLAYQLSGSGPLDLVFVNGFAIPIDLLSDDPGFVRLRNRLDGFSRTVWFDRRGLGRIGGGPPRLQR